MITSSTHVIVTPPKMVIDMNSTLSENILSNMLARANTSGESLDFRDESCLIASWFVIDKIV